RSRHGATRPAACGGPAATAGTRFSIGCNGSAGRWEGTTPRRSGASDPSATPNTYCGCCASTSCTASGAACGGCSPRSGGTTSACWPTGRSRACELGGGRIPMRRRADPRSAPEAVGELLLRLLLEGAAAPLSASPDFWDSLLQVACGNAVLLRSAASLERLGGRDRPVCVAGLSGTPRRPVRDAGTGGGARGLCGPTGREPRPDGHRRRHRRRTLRRRPAAPPGCPAHLRALVAPARRHYLGHRRADPRATELGLRGAHGAAHRRDTGLGLLSELRRTDSRSAVLGYAGAEHRAPPPAAPRLGHDRISRRAVSIPGPARQRPALGRRPRGQARAP